MEFIPGPAIHRVLCADCGESLLLQRSDDPHTPAIRDTDRAQLGQSLCRLPAEQVSIKQGSRIVRYIDLLSYHRQRGHHGGYPQTMYALIFHFRASQPLSPSQHLSRSAEIASVSCRHRLRGHSHDQNRKSFWHCASSDSRDSTRCASPRLISSGRNHTPSACGSPLRFKKKYVPLSFWWHDPLTYTPCILGTSHHITTHLGSHLHHSRASF